MLVFVDESGHPHPNDRTSRPVVVAVCFEERFSRDISRQLFRLKRNCGKEEMELKAVQLLTRGTFRRSEHLRELVESVFELIRQLPLTIFAVIMERPTREIPRDNPMLPNQ